MSRIFTYYSRYQSVQGRFTGMPGWGKLLVFLAAIPGLILLVLSLAALAVSILALSVLTVPMYRLISALAGNRAAATDVEPITGEHVRTPAETVFTPSDGGRDAPRRQIDVRIVDESETA